MTWPPASTVWPAAPDSLPRSAILPSLTPTSPLNAGIPEPSTIRPFLISRSYAMGAPPLSLCGCCYFLSRTIAQECRGPRQNSRAAATRYTAGSGEGAARRQSRAHAREQEIRIKPLISLDYEFRNRRITGRNRLIGANPRHRQVPGLALCCCGARYELPTARPRARISDEEVSK